MSLILPAHDSEDPLFPSGAHYLPAGEGPTTIFSGDTYTLKATRETTNGSLGVIEATVPPGGGPPAHIHAKSDESFYVLSGELEMLDGEKTLMARRGDFIFVPRGIRHRFKNVGVHSAILLFMFTPGGEEGLFRLGDEPVPGRPPQGWPLERFGAPEIQRFNQEWDVEYFPEAEAS